MYVNKLGDDISNLSDTHKSDNEPKALMLSIYYTPVDYT